MRVLACNPPESLAQSAISMKRPLTRFLLCLATIALPVEGASAAAMMVCGAEEAAGLSMPERHAALKAEAEAEIREAFVVQSPDDALADAAGTPGWHDAEPAGTGMDHASAPHHVAGATLLTEIPLVALQYLRHARPLATPAANATWAADLPLLPKRLRRPEQPEPSSARRC